MRYINLRFTYLLTYLLTMASYSYNNAAMHCCKSNIEQLRIEQLVTKFCHHHICDAGSTRS